MAFKFIQHGKGYIIASTITECETWLTNMGFHSSHTCITQRLFLFSKSIYLYQNILHQSCLSSLSRGVMQEKVNHCHSLIQQTTSWDIFLIFSQKTGFDISCKFSPLEKICMKHQNLFSGENKKNIVNLLCARFAQRVVKVNVFLS